MKMTPSKPTAYISDLLQFTYSAVYSQFRLTRSFILYIIRMRGWTLCGPSLYQFPVRWRKAGHYITIFSNCLHWHHVTCHWGTQLLIIYLLKEQQRDPTHQLFMLSLFLSRSFHRGTLHRQRPGVRAHLHERLLFPSAEGEPLFIGSTHSWSMSRLAVGVCLRKKNQERANGRGPNGAGIDARPEVVEAQMLNASRDAGLYRYFSRV